MVAFCTYYFIVIFTAYSCVIAAKNCKSCNPYQQVGQALYNARRQNDASRPPSLITVAPARRSRCCPYDFDSSICRVLDDRILCGYNKNAGRLMSKDAIKQLSDGCRLRGKRVECGYVHGPFTNPRRPPAWDNQPPALFDVPPQDTAGAARPLSSDLAYWRQAKRRDITYKPERVTRCMETSDNRVVCRSV